MNIAQIAPLMESCPPQLYGGTERVVSYLTEELVRQGHDVTSSPAATQSPPLDLKPAVSAPFVWMPTLQTRSPDHLIMLDKVRRMAERFDVLHFHVDVLHYPLAVDFAARTITTIHGRLDIPELRRVHAAFRSSLWFRSRTTSGSRCRQSNGPERSITAFHAICFHSIPFRRADISRFWDESPRKSGPTSQSKSRSAQERDSR